MGGLRVVFQWVDHLENPIRAHHMDVRGPFPTLCSIKIQILSAICLLEDGARMVLANSKVILTLTPEGHAPPYFPGGAAAE